MEDLSGLFEDLEQQAAALHLGERDAELADRSVAEYARVTLMSRVHASVGRTLSVRLVSGDAVTGVLEDAGVDWLAVTEETTGRGWVVAERGLASAHGLSGRAVPEPARPALARRGLAGAVRRLAAGGDVVLHLPGGRVLGSVRRVGADFVEVEPVSGEDPVGGPLTLPFRCLAAVSER